VCEIMPRVWAAKAAWFSDLFDVGFLRERLAGGADGGSGSGGLGMDFLGPRCAAAMETLIELDSAEAEQGIGSGGRGRDGGDGAGGAVDVLVYLLRRFDALREMKRAR